MNEKLKDIMRLMKRGVPVLTVNTRLSRHLRAQYDAEMQREGHAAWPTPVIMPLFSWIESLWDGTRPDRPVLSKTRALTLWEKVASGDRLISNDILMGYGVAKAGYDAYSMLQEYRIAMPEDIYLTDEAKALKRWAEAYDRDVENLGFIEQASLSGRVAELIRSGSITAPERVVIAGFDEISPRTESLIKAIEGKGGKVEFWPENQGIPRTVLVHEYADEMEEVVQAARWARKTLSPEKRIGFILPDLERYREIIRREFAAELDPEAVLPWKDTKSPFNVSLGNPLSAEPIIKAALEILSIDERAQDINRISAVLLSPYLSEDYSDHLAISRLDADLKRENRFTASLSDICKIIGRRKTDDLSATGKRLNSWITSLSDSRKNDLPSRWGDKLNNLLKAAGFPSKRVSLNSAEHQALAAWNRVLEELASLDDILGRISRTEAVSRLTKLAGDTIHQPESPESPIQVMGLLESSGLYFDHIRILGAHSDAFPSQPSPNPFIPLFIQKKHGLPHSSPERELSFSKRLVNRLINSAGSFDVSYPREVDNKNVFASPLFGPPLRKGDAGRSLTDGNRLRDLVHSKKVIEDMRPDERIPMTESETATLSGGTSIIKDQSWCPFRAFAAHRLGASGIDTPGLGLSSRDRGTIIHTALKAFWDKVRDSTRLKAIIQNSELDGLIKEAVKEAFRKTYPIEPLSRRYLGLEIERVEGLLKEWIEGVEASRGDFRVDNTECLTDMTVEGLKIRVCLDRIDRIGNDKRVIIDYKTGECSKKDWLSERPKEPQLLLYNLVDSFDAISFAKVKQKECGFIGISEEDDALPGVSSFEKDAKLREKLRGINTWGELTDSWKTVLNGLAREFMEGSSAADPIETACEYCDLTGLCRVFEKENQLG